jgi:hypothetical protein
VLTGFFLSERGRADSASGDNSEKGFEMQSNRQSYRTKWLGVTYQPLTEVSRCQRQNWMRWSVLTFFLAKGGAADFAS